MSDGLQKFNSHVNRAVDSVLITSRWTAQSLDRIKERDLSRGLVNSFINDKLLAPFQPIKYTETLVLDQYLKHTSLVGSKIHDLEVEAKDLLLVLATLEDSLDAIHGLATKDGTLAQTRKEEILAELWSMVGGNRRKIMKMDKQLTLLKQVGKDRLSAFAYVSGTILRLQAMETGLEDLRYRVTSPDMQRDIVAIPLSVHIENIQKGVERLQEVRETQRKVVDKFFKKTSDTFDRIWEGRREA